MESIKDILKRRPLPKKSCKYKWQDTALEIIKEFEGAKEKTSSIFQLCKNEPNLVLRVKAYCKETGKCHIKYFLKMINIFKR